jgi:ankyrin repeat protein
MRNRHPKRDAGQGSALMTLIRAIASRDELKASHLLDASPGLAQQAAETGATREAATDYYLKEIEHYVYSGDTALHIAAAAYAREISKRLLARGASAGARNRRGAEPLHYAVDGAPGSHTWNPTAQTAIVECLIEAGADPNSADKGGVTPLHRAVRTRCADAVRTLLANGANPHLKNASGSTSLHLAVQNTGRGGTGSRASRQQQQEIILLLLKHGARPGDKNTAGKSVTESAGASWVLDILGSA